MKKIVLLFVLIFGLLTGYSQQYPVNQFLGSPTTLVTARGALKADSALILPAFTDTAKANISPFIKNYAGTLIRVGDSVYIRSNDVTKWLLLGGGGGGASNAWLLTGNSDAYAGSSFVGTTNNIPLEFRIKNKKSGIIDSTNKNVGLGFNTLKANAPNGGTAPDGGAYGTYNVAMGHNALSKDTLGYQNVAIGGASLGTTTTRSVRNVSIGYAALNQSRTPSYDVAVGWGALARDYYGYANTAIGADVSNFFAPGVGDTMAWNTMIGYASGYRKYSGRYNVFVGDSTGAFNTTGSRNVFLGSRAGRKETGSDKLYIANDSTPNPLIKGDFASKTLNVNGKLSISTSSQVPDSSLDVTGGVKLRNIYSSNNASDSMMVIKTDGGVALRTAPKGTVTSVSQGYGITNSPNPITSTGTVAADTTTSGLSGKYLRITDTTNKWIGGITANNGLTANTNTNVQLGGTLNKVTTINSAGFPLNITGSVDETQLASLKIYNNYNSASGLGLYISSIGGGIVSSTTNNTSIYGSSTNGAGLYGFSNNNYAIVGSALGSTYAGSFESRYNSDFNTIQPVMKLSRASYGSTPLNGIGSALDLQTITSDGTINLSARIATKWNNVTFASRSSDIELYNVHNAIYGRKLALNSLGKLTLDKYGVGSFTGTPTYSLSVDASGNVIESSLSTGGVTSVATGYGLSGGTITNTGTLVADTTTGGLSGKYLRIVDTTNKWVNNVTKLNDTTITVFKGNTSTNIVLPPSIVYTENPIMSRTSGDSNIIYFNPDTANVWRGGGGGSGTVTSVAALTLGTSGTDLNSTVANSTTTPVITLNVPDASATARGVITTGTQSIAGLKSFTSKVDANGTIIGEGKSDFTSTIGIGAGQFNPDKFSLLLGNYTGYSSSGNSYGRISIGDHSTFSTSSSDTQSISIGSFTSNGGTGNFSIFIGSGTNSGTRPKLGAYNIGIGTNAFASTSATSSGGNNIGIGKNTLKSLTSGTDNIVLGNNIYTATSPSPTTFTGSYNTIIGNDITGLTATLSKNVIIADGLGRIRFKDDSTNTILPRLAGTGTRMVVAGTNGELSTQTIPSGGGGTVTSIAQGYGITNSPNPIVATGTVTVDTATLSTKYVRISDTSAALSKYVPYVGATTDVDLGTHILNAQSIGVKGTNGNGHIDLRHQASDASSTGQTTALFADANGDLKYKNAGNFYTTLKTSGNAADAVYTYPSATTTLIGAADTSVFQRKSIASYSLMANNTNATANATAITYRDNAEAAYTGTILWSSGTAPSGTTNHRYKWSQIGKTVTLSIMLNYGTVGAGNTGVTMALPSDCPAPINWNGWATGSDIISSSWGFIGASTSSATTGRALLTNNAANNGYTIIISSANTSSRVAGFTLTYFTP